MPHIQLLTAQIPKQANEWLRLVAMDGFRCRLRIRCGAAETLVARSRDVDPWYGPGMSLCHFIPFSSMRGSLEIHRILRMRRMQTSTVGNQYFADGTDPGFYYPTDVLFGFEQEPERAAEH